MRGFLALLTIMIWGMHSLHADSASLRRELDQVYRAWRNAMVTKSQAEWQKSTAAHRQMSIRNLIVSQRQPFPHAMFEMPLRPPETSLLRFVEARERGRAATLVYFGKVDIGVADPSEIPDNLLYLMFVKEATGWKFDTLRLINLEPMPEVRSALKNGGKPELLNEPELQPQDVVPAVAKPCPVPDWVGVLQIASFGYETSASVNQFDVATVTDNMEEHIIIGGLRNGANPLRLELKEVPLPPEAPPNAERVIHISALVLTGEEKRPTVQVFSWKPEKPPGSGPIDLLIHVSQNTMRR